MYYFYSIYNHSILQNPAQMQAIQCALAPSFKTPYILYGPPGTGKSSTVTEMILQVWMLNVQILKLINLKVIKTIFDSSKQFFNFDSNSPKVAGVFVKKYQLFGPIRRQNNRPPPRGK